MVVPFGNGVRCATTQIVAVDISVTGGAGDVKVTTSNSVVGIKQGGFAKDDVRLPVAENSAV
jgi:hypothetical protein